MMIIWRMERVVADVTETQSVLPPPPSFFPLCLHNEILRREKSFDLIFLSMFRIFIVLF